LNALKRVYEWALSREVSPMFLSEYSRWVLDFRQTAVMRWEEGFRIKNAGGLRTLRYPKEWGYPDTEKSKGMVGYREGKDGYNYLFLDGSGDYYVVFSYQKPKFALLYSNGYVESFERKGKEYSLRLSSYLPLAVRLETSCKVFINGKAYNPGVVEFKGGKRADIKAVCTN
jgi:hypothetical protein